MEILERIWDQTTHVFSGLLSGFERGITNLFGSSNARYVKKLQSKVEAIQAATLPFAARAANAF
jgi:preprotein translocase subunit SecA